MNEIYHITLMLNGIRRTMRLMSLKQYVAIGVRQRWLFADENFQVDSPVRVGFGGVGDTPELAVNDFFNEIDRGTILKCQGIMECERWNV